MADAEFKTHKDQNDLQATMYTGEGGAGLTAILDPRYFTPMEYFGMFSNGWYNWRVKAANTRSGRAAAGDQGHPRGVMKRFRSSRPRTARSSR